MFESRPVGPAPRYACPLYCHFAPQFLYLNVRKPARGGLRKSDGRRWSTLLGFGLSQHMPAKHERFSNHGAGDRTRTGKP